MDSSHRLSNKILSNRYWLYSILFGVCILAYFNSLKNGFLIDDYGLFLNNFKADYAKYYLYEFFPSLNPFQPVTPAEYYRPLMNIIPRILYQINGENVIAFHCIGLAVMFGVSIAIIRWLDLLFQNRRLSFLTAILFMIHPLNGIIVYYNIAVVFGMQIMAMIWSMLFFHQAAEGKEPRRSILWSITLFIVAILCHENALMLPLVIIAMYAVCFPSQLIKALKFLIPHGCVFILSIGLKIFQGYSMANIADIKTFPDNPLSLIAGAARLVAWYIQQLIAPEHVVFIWSTQEGGVQEPNWAIIGAVFLILSLLLTLHPRLSKPLRFGASCFFISIITVLLACRFEPILGLLIEPHWLYLPSIALFAVIAHAFLIGTRPLTQWTLRIILLFYIVYLLMNTWTLNQLWGNEKRYCQYWAANAPQLSTPLIYLSSAYSQEQKEYEAQTNLIHAYELNPESSVVNYYLAHMFLAHNQLDLAEDHFLKAQIKSPQSSMILHSLALLELRKGNIEEAQSQLEQALLYNPMLLEGRLDLVKIQLHKGNWKRAEELLNTNLAIAPKHLSTLTVQSLLGQFKSR